MGTGDETVATRFSEAESDWKRFVAQSSRLAELRQHMATVEAEPASEALLHGLRGWYRFFDCNVIEDPKAQALMDELIAAEHALFARRKTYQPMHIDEQGELVSLRNRFVRQMGYRNCRCD